MIPMMRPRLAGFGGVPSINGTWDPVTNRNVNVALSNSNLTATGNNATQAGGVQSTTSLVSGIYYLEFTVGGTVNNRWVGLGNASSLTGNGNALNDANSIGYLSSNGAVTALGVAKTALASFGTGDIIGMKVDRNAGTACFNKNGGPFSVTYTLPSGPIFARMAALNGGSVTLQKSPKYPVPAGCSYWGSLTQPIPGVTKRIFLTSGTSWTVPNDWNNADNTIEMIDGGGAPWFDANMGSGGGTNGGYGGDYRRYSNVVLTKGAAAAYSVGAGANPANARGGTSTHTGCTTPSLTRSGGFPAAVASQFGFGFKAAGGGAAGPDSNGGNASIDGGDGTATGGAPGSGVWTSTHNAAGAVSVATAGPGAGGNNLNNGFPYGGGGGYQRDNDNGDFNGFGAQGIIVITYTTVP